MSLSHLLGLPTTASPGIRRIVAVILHLHLLGHRLTLLSILLLRREQMVAVEGVQLWQITAVIATDTAVVGKEEAWREALLLLRLLARDVATHRVLIEQRRGASALCHTQSLRRTTSHTTPDNSCTHETSGSVGQCTYRLVPESHGDRRPSSTPSRTQARTIAVATTRIRIAVAAQETTVVDVAAVAMHVAVAQRRHLQRARSALIRQR